MQLLPSISYPDNEKPKLALLESLFRDWHRHFASNASSLVKHKPEEMVFDGFYPHYFSQKRRILFIGWEAVDISNQNNMAVLFEVYHHGKHLGDTKHINNDKFHSRMLRIVYGVMNGMPSWETIPSASEIGDMIGTPDGLSFAFLNISKLSNETGSPKADWPVINAAYLLSTSGRNYIQEEILILEPDIIVTMNADKLPAESESLGKWTLIHRYDQAESYWLSYGGNRTLVVNTWHLSARGTNGGEDYYVPICNAIRDSEASSQTDGRVH